MGIQQLLLGAGAETGPVTGQVEWDNDTTLDYTATWTVPTGVEKISVLCIGRGGQSSTSYGGAGGSLTYANDISVTAGETLNIRISGGYSAGATVDGQQRYLWGSRLYKGSLSSPTWAVIAQCALTESATSGSGVNVTATSYSGGDAGAGYQGGWSTYHHGGSGGAAGYAGVGGEGGTGTGTGVNGTAGSGGGGGGAATNAFSFSGSGTLNVGGGGGVGRFGQGSNGAGGTGYGKCGVGGSGGTPASSTGTQENNTSFPPGSYGGGNGKCTGGTDAQTKGGKGLVRIIYPGDDRYYPSTLTTNQ